MSRVTEDRGCHQDMRWGPNPTTKEPSLGTHLIASSKFLEEVVNVCIDFLWLFLVEEVSYSFHYNNFLQERNILFQTTIVYKFLYSREVIGNVQVAHNKLNWYFNL